jgi:hypothetical protein
MYSVVIRQVRSIEQRDLAFSLKAFHVIGGEETFGPEIEHVLPMTLIEQKLIE